LWFEQRILRNGPLDLRGKALFAWQSILPFPLLIIAVIALLLVQKGQEILFSGKYADSFTQVKLSSIVTPSFQENGVGADAFAVNRIIKSVVKTRNFQSWKWFGLKETGKGYLDAFQKPRDCSCDMIRLRHYYFARPKINAL